MVITIALVVAAIAVVTWWLQRNWYVLQYVYFLRVPIIVLGVAWALPGSLRTEAQTITSNWFDLSAFGFFVVTLFSTTLAWSVMVQAGMIWEGGAIRNKLAANKARNRAAAESESPPTNRLWTWIAYGEIPLLGSRSSGFWADHNVTDTTALKERRESKFISNFAVAIPYRLLIAGVVGAGPIVYSCIARSEMNGWAIAAIVLGAVSAYLIWLMFDYVRQSRLANERKGDEEPSTSQMLESLISTVIGKRVSTFFGDTGYRYQRARRIFFTFRSAVWYALTIFVVAVIVGIVTFPRWWMEFDVDFPALAYICLFVTFLGWIAAFGTYLLDKYRIPVLALMLTVPLIFQKEHYFDTRPLTESQVETRAENRPGFAWDTSDLSIVVAVNGGGITASYFTALVLCDLSLRYGDDFIKRLAFISSVSGGSVGSMFYLGAKSPHPCMPPGDDAKPDDIGSNPVVQAAGRSSLSEVGWGLVYADMFPIKFSKMHDRAWAQERRWLRELEKIGDGRNWLSQWRRDLSPFHFAFNSTLAESGEQMVISTYDFKESFQTKSSVPGGSSTYLREFSTLYQHYDVHIVTAARLSATFPYVTPLARPDFGDEPLEHDYPYHHADGGFFDNWGVSTAIEYIRSVGVGVEDAQHDGLGNQKRRFLLLEIRASDPHARDGEIKAVRAGLFGPIKTMLRVWSSSAVGRNARELALLGELKDKLDLCNEALVLEIEAPLSWHLSNVEKEAIMNGFNSNPNEEAKKNIGAYLSNPSTCVWPGQKSGDFDLKI